MYRAFIVDILEQLLPGKFLTPLDDLGDLGITNVDLVLDSALAFELDAKFRSREFGMSIPHCRQAERVVASGILHVSDANQRRFEELDDHGEDLFPR